MADLQAEIDAAVAAVSKQGEVVRSLKGAVKTGEAEKVMLWAPQTPHRSPVLANSMRCTFVG